MTTRQLEYVIAISAAGSFRKAAETLYISQPSLSMAVKSLEEEIGVPLFIRTRNGVSLTPAGDQIIEDSKTIMNLIYHWNTPEVDPDVSDKISLQAQGVLVSTLIPRILTQYNEECPGSNVSVEELIHFNLQKTNLPTVKLLFCEEAKFPALMKTAEQNGYQSRVLCMEPMRVFLNHENPLCKRSPVYMRDLSGMSYASFDSLTLSCSPYADFFRYIPNGKSTYLPNREAILEAVAHQRDVISHFSFVAAATSPYVMRGEIKTKIIADYPMQTLVLAIYNHPTNPFVSDLLDLSETIVHRLQADLLNHEAFA